VRFGHVLLMCHRIEQLTRLLALRLELRNAKGH
jgi:hypothetical protein